MATISSMSSTYSSIVAGNKGIGGLATGLDTDTIVEALTAGTRGRIATQYQKKQLLEWKQEGYRGVIGNINSFYNKYFDKVKASATNNITSSNFFNTYKATTSSNKVILSTTTNSTVGKFTIDEIKQLATSQTLTNGATISKELTSETAFDPTHDFTGEKLTLTVDGDTKTIKLDTLNGCSTDQEFQEQLQNLVNAAFGKKKDYNTLDPVTQKPIEVPRVDVKVNGMKVSLENSSGRVTVSATCDALKLKSGQTNRVDMSTKIGEVASLAGLVGDTFRFTINDKEITVTKDDTISSFMSKINNSGADVRITYSTINDTFTLSSVPTGAGDNLRIQDVEGNLMNLFFGSKSASSLNASASGMYRTDPLVAENLFNLDLLAMAGVSSWSDYDLSDPEDEKALKEFCTKLSTMTFNMQVGNASTTISLDASKIQESIEDGSLTEAKLIQMYNDKIKEKFGDDCGVYFQEDSGKIQLVSDDKQLVAITSTSSAEYNALEKIFGFTSDKTTAVNLSNNTEITGGASTLNTATLTEGKKITFNLTINGDTKLVTYELTAADEEELGKAETDPDDYLSKKLLGAIHDAFGEAVVASESENQKNLLVGFEKNADGKMILTTDTSLEVSISKDTTTPGNIDLLDVFGFTSGATNLSDDRTSVTLGQMGITDGTLTINGETVNYTDGMTMEQLINAINTKAGAGTAKIVDGQLVLNGKTDSSTNYEPMLTISDSGGNLMQTLFGVNAYDTKNESYGNRMTAGQNSEVVMDGEVISNSSNTINIHGVNVELTAVSDPNDDPIVINVASDPDEMVDKIKGFIDDYNAMVKSITTLLTEKTDSKYPPLTDEQKADMTEDEIKKWENEAKKGILRSDPTLRTFINSLRATIYEKVEAAGIAAYDIGITTVSIFTASGSADYTNDGLLEITEAGEEKLRKMLENNPDAVRELFTNDPDGIATKMNEIIKSATLENSTNRGTLISIAGTETLTADNTSILGDRIKEIDKIISTLKLRLETEYNRYWKKFSALEVALQNMAAQSSWLSDSLSS